MSRTLRVGYRTFGRTSLNYGMYLCLEQARTVEGVRLESMGQRTAGAFDVLLFSLFWWEHLYDYAAFLRRCGVDPAKSRKPLVIIGGFQAYNFVSLGSLYHWACIGDGEGFLPDALALARDGQEEMIGELSGAYWPGKTEITRWRSDAFSATAMVEPGQKATRIEIARGCRYRCAFCALSYLKPYREGRPEDIKALIAQGPNKNVALFAPERLAHSGYDEIECFTAAAGKTNTASDLRWDNLKTRPGHKGTVLFGLEGLSERLRLAIGKGITDSDFVDGCQKLVAESEKGKRGIRFYLILGLPGETEEDYAAWTELLRRLNAIPEANSMTLMPFVNTFLTQPHTPLQWAAAADPFGDYTGRFQLALWPHGHDDSKRWRMTIAFTPRIWGPLSRIKAQLAVRGDARVEGVLRDLAANRKLTSQTGRPGRVGARLFARYLEKHWGYDLDYLCGTLAPEGRYPWQVVETHVPTTGLRRRWQAYQRRVDMIDRECYLAIKSSRLPRQQDAES
ncbi:MAG: hypothetical protein A2Z99_08365 [Treponema sp. GWB1_62_6]|nr:MAG: hypothetical protein A2Z99_08365 [Treponema sp. GWB1_62_6]